MEPVTKFLNALHEGRIKEFFLGEGDFYATTGDFPDEYSMVAGWHKFILPYVTSSQYSESFISPFKQAMMQLLNEQDVSKGLYYFVRHLYCYYYYKQERKISFDLQITDEEKEKVKAALSKNKQQLKQDQRWAGASWHSKDGLWEPLQKDLEIIRDRFGGVDLLYNE